MGLRKHIIRKLCMCLLQLDGGHLLWMIPISAHQTLSTCNLRDRACLVSETNDGISQTGM